MAGRGEFPIFEFSLYGPISPHVLVRAHHSIQGKVENRKLPLPYWLICKIIQVGRERGVSYFRVFTVWAYQPTRLGTCPSLTDCHGNRPCRLYEYGMSEPQLRLARHQSPAPSPLRCLLYRRANHKGRVGIQRRPCLQTSFDHHMGLSAHTSWYVPITHRLSRE